MCLYRRALFLIFTTSVQWFGDGVVIFYDIYALSEHLAHSIEWPLTTLLRSMKGIFPKHNGSTKTLRYLLMVVQETRKGTWGPLVPEQCCMIIDRQIIWHPLDTRGQGFSMRLLLSGNCWHGKWTKIMYPCFIVQYLYNFSSLCLIGELSSLCIYEIWFPLLPS